MEDKELTQWEYKRIGIDGLNEKKLNEYGKEGWETTASIAGGSEVILKRPKEKKEPSQGYGRS